MGGLCCCTARRHEANELIEQDDVEVLFPVVAALAVTHTRSISSHHARGIVSELVFSYSIRSLLLVGITPSTKFPGRYRHGYYIAYIVLGFRKEHEAPKGHGFRG